MICNNRTKSIDKILYCLIQQQRGEMEANNNGEKANAIETEETAYATKVECIDVTEGMCYNQIKAFISGSETQMSYDPDTIVDELADRMKLCYDPDTIVVVHPVRIVDDIALISADPDDSNRTVFPRPSSDSIREPPLQEQRRVKDLNE